MSIFQLEDVTCPSCGARSSLDVSYSVNADLRPDLRQQVLDGTLQRTTCPSCRSVFRLEPRLTWLDVGRGQWIAARPADELAQWREQERRALETFGRVQGALGEGISPRVTFGWAALREKLTLQQLGLDDVAVEVLKIAMIRDLEAVTFSPTRALRVVARREDALILAWIDDAAGADGSALSVPLRTYTAIRAEAVAWAALSADLSAGPLVDARRLMLA